MVGFHLGLEPAGSHEVGLALRHAILPKQYGPEYELETESESIVFGAPEYWLTDRAKEFKSKHLQLISMQVGFQRRLRAFPQAGGLIETIFDTLNKELLSLLPGYTGSSVADRPKDAEKHACITLNELEKRLVKYFFDNYNWRDYPRVEDQKRNERWQSLLLTEPEVLDERELDVCLMKVAHRKVEKYGSVEFERLVYQGDCLVPYEGEEVSLRYDQRNITAMLVYTRPSGGQPGEFIGVVHARDLKDEQMSLQELRWYKHKLRDRGDEVNHDSIVAERLGLYEFIDQKRKSKRQRRKQANQQHQQQTNASKVVELFPQNDTAKPAAQTKSKGTKTKPAAQEVTAELADATPDLPLAVPETEIVPSIAAPDGEPDSPAASASTGDPSQAAAVESSYGQAAAYDWNQLLADNW